jgi:hypothetical protein
MTIKPVPIKRDAFLYMEGDGDKQCKSCWLWNWEDKRCTVLPTDLEVRAEDSCGYWGPESGTFFADRSVAPQFTPEEVGFVRREVRCENCYYFNRSGRCFLFHILNDELPDHFNLDTEVSPKGCCNAQTPRRQRVVT